MMRLHLRAGVVISWETDGSLQQMTMVTTSLESWRKTIEIMVNQSPFDYWNTLVTVTV
jgi:hypothetical protein